MVWYSSQSSDFQDCVHIRYPSSTVTMLPPDPPCTCVYWGWVGSHIVQQILHWLFLLSCPPPFFQFIGYRACVRAKIQEEQHWKQNLPTATALGMKPSSCVKSLFWVLLCPCQPLPEACSTELRNREIHSMIFILRVYRGSDKYTQESVSIGTYVSRVTCLLSILSTSHFSHYEKFTKNCNRFSLVSCNKVSFT